MKAILTLGLRHFDPSLLSDYSQGFSIVLVGSCAFLVLVSVLLLVLASQKVTAIKKPNPHLPLRWNQTYCVVSLWAVNLIRLGLVFNVLRLSYYAWVLGWEEKSAWASEYAWLLAAANRLWFILMLWLVEAVLYTSSFEWIIMKNLILQQKNRTVQQIMFDSQHSTFTRALQSQAQPSNDQQIESERTWSEPGLFPMQQFDHMRKEQWLSSGFKAGLALILFIWTAVLNFDVLFPSEEHLALLIMTLLLTWSVCFHLYNFLTLRRWMLKMHQHEYFVQRQTLIIQVTLSVTIELLFAFQMLCTWEPILLGLEMGVSILQIPFLVLSLVLITVKSPQDCLQGLSKLDYLLKVSWFQQYRMAHSSTSESNLGTPTLSFEFENDSSFYVSESKSCLLLIKRGRTDLRVPPKEDSFSENGDRQEVRASRRNLK